MSFVGNLLSPPLKALLLNMRRDLGLWYGRQWQKRCRFETASCREEAHRFLNEHANEMFFVLGSGRSGTQLVSNLLQASGDARVFHEPNFNEDVGTMEEFRATPSLAVNYWQLFRSVEVFRRWSEANSARLYGEVNGTIRYQANAIKQLYPDAKLFLLARDGRGFVRSVMGWPQFYSPTSKGAYALSPLSGDPYRDRWNHMTRFEKVCWSWMETNDSLSRMIPESRHLQLELIASDYSYCMDRLLSPLGITLSQADWQNCVSAKSANASTSYGFPAWGEWTADDKAIFRDICKDTMDRLGYKIT